MKKNIILFLLVLGVTSSAQKRKMSSCEEIVLNTTKAIKENNPFRNFSLLFKRLKPCADKGNLKAQNYIGLMYIEGLGTEKNEVLGFQYIEQAALAGLPIAQGNLGKLYKYGTGCNINPNKAVEWFKKGAANGNQRASYLLGYMYYKGIGIQQDYKEAVKLFEQSSDPMAKHWLGTCYYFGYGVPQNTEKAVAYLTTNGTLNSEYFMEHVKAEKKKQEEANVNKTLESAFTKEQLDKKVLLEAHEIIEFDSTLENKDIVGSWIGKWIEYDESGKIVQRILPIEMSFIEDEFGDLKTNIVFNNKSISDYVLFEDNNLFVDNFKFNLQKQYTHDAYELSLDYQVLGMDISTQPFGNQAYLLADMDVYIPEWKEIAPPMSLVLRPKNNNTTIKKEEEEVMLALAAQKEEFIKLYPVPFTNQLHIGFFLEETTYVQVNITGVHSGQTEILEPGKTLQAGEQTYHANVNNLKSGLYIVKVIANGRVNTRIVVKN